MARTNKDADPNPAVNDAYTGMLAIALLALIGGSALLALDYFQYDQKPPPATAKSAPAAAPVVAPVPGEPPAKEEKKEPPKDEKKEPAKEEKKEPPKDEKKEPAKEEKKD